jgi:hypothetical protein
MMVAGEPDARRQQGPTDGGHEYHPNLGLSMLPAHRATIRPGAATSNGGSELSGPPRADGPPLGPVRVRHVCVVPQGDHRISALVSPSAAVAVGTRLSARLGLMKFQPWLLIIFGIAALVSSPFARSWEGVGFGTPATLVGGGLLALDKWMDRRMSRRR